MSSNYALLRINEDTNYQRSAIQDTDPFKELYLDVYPSPLQSVLGLGTKSTPMATIAEVVNRDQAQLRHECSMGLVKFAVVGIRRMPKSTEDYMQIRLSATEYPPHVHDGWVDRVIPSEFGFASKVSGGAQLPFTFDKACVRQHMLMKIAGIKTAHEEMIQIYGEPL